MLIYQEEQKEPAIDWLTKSLINGNFQLKKTFKLLLSNLKIYFY